MSDLVTTAKAALILGVSSKRVLQLVKDGTLRPAHSIRNSRRVLFYQFRREDVEALRDARER